MYPPPPRNSMFAVAGLLLLALTGCAATPCRLHSRQTEQSWAQSLDPNTECGWYDYPPVDAISPNYPQAYTTAQILGNDSAAWSIFNALNSTVTSRLPNDNPRGTPEGDFNGVNYPSSDPDCWWTWNGCTTPANTTGIPADLSSVPEPNTWGLTIDDGPLCSHNAYYDFFAENQQKATLFYIGSNILSYPLQALRGFDDGHQICVHTWSHKYMTSLTNEEVFAELYYTRQLIKDLMGVTPKCWRPPYGDVDNRVRMFAMGLNLTTIIWDRDTADWTLDSSSANAQTWDTVNSNYQSFIDEASNGTFSTYGPIVLSHELSNATMSEMMTYYPKIKAAFSHIVPIAAAMNQTDPYVETNWVYPTFEQYISGNINQTNTTATPSSLTSSSASSPTSAASHVTGVANAVSQRPSASASHLASGSGRVRIVAMGRALGFVLFVSIASLGAMDILL